MKALRTDEMKASAVASSYHYGRLICETLDFFLSQTYKAREHIIIDDGSTDETLQTIKSYKDERIKYLRREKNRDLPHALNTGFAKATGEYLTWTSDDNYYAKEAMERMVLFLRDKNCLFVYCDYYRVEGNNPSTPNLIKLPKYVTFEYINCVRACFLYSKKAKELIGDFDPETELAEDYDYWIRVSKEFWMHHLDEPLYFYRTHNESLYSSRYYDVQVVKLLVRLKHNIMDIDQITDALINFIAWEKRGFFKLDKVLAKILFFKEIDAILREFKIEKISFQKSKSDLKNIVTRRFINSKALESVIVPIYNCLKNTFVKQLIVSLLRILTS